MVHVLASGVFFSGFMKDLLCLPRPLSPPLQRITLSGSAALEYGFPSTHSTNAMSVATYAFFALRTAGQPLHPVTQAICNIALFGYVVSIVAGRLYCGMHGFVDVAVGSALGAVLTAIQCQYGEAFDDWLYQGTYANPLLVVFVVLVLVRLHPEPADNCPCFDDSVAFAGVIIGVELGSWHYAGYPNPTYHATTYAPNNTVWWAKNITRILLGVGAIFVWRGFMKAALLRYLPPVFRVFEHMGLLLPRRYFVRAS